MLNLRFTAGVGVGISPLSSSSGTEPLPAPPKDAAFSSLFSLFSISLFLSVLAWLL